MAAAAAEKQRLIREEQKRLEDEQDKKLEEERLAREAAEAEKNKANAEKD